MTKDVTLRASLMVAGGGYVIRGTNSFPVTSRAAVVYAHKNETIDVITSKSSYRLKFIQYTPVQNHVPQNYPLSK